MASTTFLVNKNASSANIILRFWRGKAIDITARTGLYVIPKFWDFKNKKIRNVTDIPSREEINSKLAKLQIAVIDSYNVAHSNGEIVDKQWLEKTVARFFNRPTGEVLNKISGHHVYLSDFAAWWMEEKAPTFKVSNNKYISKATLAQYEQALISIKAFEGRNKIKLRDVTSEKLDEMSVYLSDTMKYTPITVKRKMVRIKFFCSRAEAENLDINKNYKSRVFVKEEEETYKHPYLNEAEIKNISRLDLSHDKTLDNARDNLIIGLWTGLRVSDFLTSLNINDINGDFIEIRTKKTRHSVAIPLHPQVVNVLKKHNGQLPPKISEQKFNDKIKIIGQIAEIDEEMIGGISAVEEKGGPKRKVVKMYKKYELMTSHICRRSFCTNLIGKVPDKVIMDCAGWKSAAQMHAYNKTTNLESAIALKKHWDTKI